MQKTIATAQGSTGADRTLSDDSGAPSEEHTGPQPLTLEGSTGRKRGWLSFVLTESRGPRNALTRLPTIMTRFGLSSDKIERQFETLLRVTDAYGARPTLPVTAMTAQRHPDIIRRLAKRGVEIAGHGYVHNDFASLTAGEQEEQMRAARDALVSLGLEIRGWRCPYFRWNAHTIQSLARIGFDYDSSTVFAWPVLDAYAGSITPSGAAAYERLRALFSARDAREHVVLPTMIDTMVEIPAALPQDEDMVDRLHLDGVAREQVWLSLLQLACAREEIFVLNLHPERVDLCAHALATTLGEARRRGDVWIASLAEIARWWRARDAASVHLERSGSGWTATMSGPPGLTLMYGDRDPRSSRSLEIDSTFKPVAHCGPAWPLATTQRLRDLGYVISRDDADSGRCAVDLDQELHTDASNDEVARCVKRHDHALLHFDRWPHGYRSALSVTGDIDALTLIDFAFRLKEF